jgi:hypothetical protein
MFTFEEYWVGYPSLDRYYQGNTALYVILSPTTLEICEIGSLLGCFYLLRNYPSEFLVKQEVLFSLGTAIVMSIIGQNTFYNNVRPVLS